jgi:putative transposase
MPLYDENYYGTLVQCELILDIFKVFAVCSIMPRHARLDAPGTLHHVIGRGIAETKIFRTKKDREDFLHRVAKLCETGSIAVYAWALMDTHFHLLVRTGKDTLSSSMRRLLTGFVVNFNKRHKRYGHLFQNRYKSIVCEEDPYLLELTQYIHLNPLRAGNIKDVAELDTYRWTGHGVIMGKSNYSWQDTDTILVYFGKTAKEAQRRYHHFIEQGITLGTKPDLTGGGLIRSAGGRAEVASIRRRRKLIPSDERILGSGTFVRSILAEAGKIFDDTLSWKTSLPDLPMLSKFIAQKENIDLSSLLSGSRRRLITQARRLLCQIAVKKLRFSGASVARYLGVTTSLVNRMANEIEITDLDEYLTSSL